MHISNNAKVLQVLINLLYEVECMFETTAFFCGALVSFSGVKHAANTSFRRAAWVAVDGRLLSLSCLLLFTYYIPAHYFLTRV